MKKSKLVLISVGICCLSFLLVKPMYAILGDKLTKTPTPTCPPNEVEDEAVLLPDPDNCENYYSCNRGVPFLMKCYPGLQFNAELQICDWPEKANCNKR